MLFVKTITLIITFCLLVQISFVKNICCYLYIDDRSAEKWHHLISQAPTPRYWISFICYGSWYFVFLTSFLVTLLNKKQWEALIWITDILCNTLILYQYQVLRKQDFIFIYSHFKIWNILMHEFSLFLLRAYGKYCTPFLQKAQQVYGAVLRQICSILPSW